jgi:hypothetical protein
MLKSQKNRDLAMKAAQFVWKSFVVENHGLIFIVGRNFSPLPQRPDQF